MNRVGDLGVGSAFRASETHQVFAVGGGQTMGAEHLRRNDISVTHTCGSLVEGVDLNQISFHFRGRTLGVWVWRMGGGGEGAGGLPLKGKHVMPYLNL